MKDINLSSLEFLHNLNFREAQNRDHRVIGTFIPGTNSPLDMTQMQAEFMNPDFHAQIYLSVAPLFASSDKPRNVWLQYLMDVPLKVPSEPYGHKT